MDAIIRSARSPGARVIDVIVVIPPLQEILRHGAAARAPGATAAAEVSHTWNKHPGVDITSFVVEHFLRSLRSK